MALRRLYRLTTEEDTLGVERHTLFYVNRPMGFQTLLKMYIANIPLSGEKIIAVEDLGLVEGESAARERGALELTEQGELR